MKERKKEKMCERLEEDERQTKIVKGAETLGQVEKYRHKICY